VDAAVERLAASGATVLVPPADRPWNERMAYVADPEGRPIHLFAPLGGGAPG
jgi:lactoylglutathione lyase